MKANINNTSLKVSAGYASQFPRDLLPQVVFSGRSNVGKSSVINSITNRKNLARTSSSPGKTITINFYNVDSKLYLVDLPGYGYAKRTYEEQVKWSNLTEGYLTNKECLDRIKLVCQLVDSKVGPTDDDFNMINYLIQSKIDFIIVATKIDKLNKTDLKKSIDSLLNLNYPSNFLGVIPYSSKNGEGKNNLIKTIFDKV